MPSAKCKCSTYVCAVTSTGNLMVRRSGSSGMISSTTPLFHFGQNARDALCNLFHAEGLFHCSSGKRHAGALAARTFRASRRVGCFVLAFRTRRSGRVASKVRRRTRFSARRPRRALPIRKGLRVVVVLVALRQIWHLVPLRDVAAMVFQVLESWKRDQFKRPSGRNVD